MPSKPTIPCVCERCGGTYHATRHQVANGRRFCSPPCFYWTGSRPEKTCIGCGRAFNVSPSDLKRKWCSASCRYGTPGWQEALGTRSRKDCICAICGKSFTVVASRVGTYCSRKCLGIANGRRNPGQDPTTRTTYTCEECGRQFVGLACLSYRKRFCSRTCLGLWTCRRRRIMRPTSIELMLEAALAEAGVQTVREYPIGRFNIDLAIPSRCVAIEADGSYWHSLPKQQAADARKNAALKAAGWEVLRFGEEQIRANVQQCVAEVLATLG